MISFTGTGRTAATKPMARLRNRRTRWGAGLLIAIFGVAGLKATALARDYGKAPISDLQRAVSRRPYNLIAAHYLDRALRFAAITELQDATERYPGDDAARRHLTRALRFATGDHLRLALEHAPRHRLTLRMAGLRMLYEAKWYEAKRLLDRAMRAGDRDPVLLRSAADLALRMGDHSGAAEALKALVTVRPADSEAHLLLAAVYQQTRLHQKSYAEALASARLNPTPDALRLTALEARTLRWKDEFEQAARALVKADPNNWQAHALLAEALILQHRRVEAVAENEEAVRVAPREPGGYLALGQQQVDEASSPADLERALTTLQQGARLAPADPRIQEAIGITLYKLGRLADARRTLEQVQKLTPRAAEATLHLSRIYRSLGLPAEAAREAARLRRLRSELTRGVLLEERLALSTGAAQLTARLALARYLVRMGNLEVALQHYERLAHWPEMEQARRELRQLEVRLQARAARQTVASSLASEPSRKLAGP